MTTVLGVEMVVKNTFLEVAEEEVAGKLPRCKTAPGVLTAWSMCCLSGGLEDSDIESEVSARGASSAASTTSSTRPTGLALPSSSRGPRGKAAAAGIAAAEGTGAGRGGAQQADDGHAAAHLRSSGAHTHRGSAAAVAVPPVDGEATFTTVMLKNLPNDYTRPMIQQLLDEHGFACRYDFLYLPTDFRRRAGLGYAFVNMISPADAAGIREALEGFCDWILPTVKVCSIGWSVDQGLEANVERYRNSPVMHPSVPDSFKPILLRDGERVPFPEPTRKLKRPMARRLGQ